MWGKKYCDNNPDTTVKEVMGKLGNGLKREKQVFLLMDHIWYIVLYF
jgi:hypothetical protein